MEYKVNSHIIVSLMHRMDAVHSFVPFRFLLHITFQVYDIFGARISETVGFAGLQKCGWSEAWE
jgi:hypothetical protein